MSWKFLTRLFGPVPNLGAYGSTGDIWFKPTKMPANNTRVTTGLYVCKCAGIIDFPTSRTAFRCTGLPQQSMDYFSSLCPEIHSVHTEFSQTLNNKSPKSDDGSEEILFTSFSLQMWIHRTCFWPMFSLQPKCNRWQCSRKTVKMATLWLIGRKMTVIEIKLCYNCFYVK